MDDRTRMNAAQNPAAPPPPSGAVVPPQPSQSIPQGVPSQSEPVYQAASQQQGPSVQPDATGTLPTPLPKTMPDLTSAQQVPSAAMVSSAPIGSNVLKQAAPPPPSKSLPKSPGFSFPKLLLYAFFGFIGIAVLFIVVRFVSSFFQAGGQDRATLTYWGLWEDKSVMQTIIDDFQRQHPTITVNYIKQDSHEYSKSLLTRIQNGTGPDIYRYHVTWLPMLLPSLLPLSTDVISKSDFIKAYYPVIQHDLIKNGALYGIPLSIDTLSLYVNNKMLNDAKATVPTTWDTFIATARALTTRDSNGKIQVAGAAMGTYDNITHAPDIMSLLFVQNGVTLSTMTPASNAIDALNFYTSFATDQNNVWDNTLDPSLLAFERGKLAMYIGYSYDTFSIKAASPDLDFSIYPVPHLPGRDTTIASYWVEGVSSKTTHPKEALMFMHYLAQKDTATKLYTQEAKLRLFGEPYARLDLADSLKSDKLVYPFVSQAGNASSSFFAGETQDSGINAQMNGYLGNAINSIQKQTSVETAVDTLTKGVAQILTQYGQ